MSDAFTGGCACGAIRYEISAEPLVMGDCQCRHCQQRSGTGHGSYLTFASRQAVKVEGDASHWQIAADNGNVKSHAFCPTCGSPLYLTFSAAPELFTVHAASLDDPSRYVPQIATFTVRGHAWDHLDSVSTKFERMPTG
ncbi:GFA family protein [Bosea sp. (in: a-proteobacteria)]|uniref:GFA family protein n=1 Tax=Bosea sp. (in: a-proteobacteria) TaxID=1871050 RepID=UPI002FC8C108